MTGDPKKPAWARPVKPGLRTVAPIAITDTPANAVLKLAENDLPAAKACIALIETSQALDPGSEFGPFTPLVMLERMHLRGAKIAALFALAGGEPATCLMLLHAARLGVLKPDAVARALKGATPLEIEVLWTAVLREMPQLRPK